MSRERWLLVEETGGELWLIERQGAELRGRPISRPELLAAWPSLSRALVASDNMNAPRVVVEPASGRRA
jgi:hypothetical protein